MEPKKISVIIPAKNEAGTIEKIVRELDQIRSVFEIVFIEGQSSDDTWDKIKDVTNNYHGEILIKSKKQDGVGKANAIFNGFEVATGDIFIVYDSDMSVSASDLKKVMKELLSERGVVIGTRFKERMENNSMSRLNFIANKIFAILFNLLFKTKISDTLCGTKGFWKEDYFYIKKHRRRLKELDPFGDFDIILSAIRQKVKITEISIHYKSRIYGKTNISRWRDGLRLLKMIFLVTLDGLYEDK